MTHSLILKIQKMNKLIPLLPKSQWKLFKTHTDQQEFTKDIVAQMYFL